MIYIIFFPIPSLLLEKKSPIKFVVKKMLKSKAYTEEFLIGCIQMFPFKKCKLLNQVKLFSIIKL